MKKATPYFLYLAATLGCILGGIALLVFAAHLRMKYGSIIRIGGYTMLVAAVGLFKMGRSHAGHDDEEEEDLRVQMRKRREARRRRNDPE